MQATYSPEDNKIRIYPDDLKGFRRQFIDMVGRAERYGSLVYLLERAADKLQGIDDALVAEILAELPEE